MRAWQLPRCFSREWKRRAVIVSCMQPGEMAEAKSDHVMLLHLFLLPSLTSSIPPAPSVVHNKHNMDQVYELLQSRLSVDLIDSMCCLHHGITTLPTADGGLAWGPSAVIRHVQSPNASHAAGNRPIASTMPQSPIPNVEHSSPSCP